MRKEFLSPKSFLILDKMVKMEEICREKQKCWM
uniref:Uncharacterized protein n=1 Tax=Arundo donax TaxID=35708 RepID=A0A0A9HS56_ARUDO